LPNTEKLYLLKLYYSKKMWNFVFNYNKNDLYHQKAYKNLHIRYLNSFLYLKLFSSYTLSKTRFWPSIQSLLDILVRFRIMQVIFLL
jgi:hypothetical protein